jgi:hypothetical protein
MYTGKKVIQVCVLVEILYVLILLNNDAGGLKQHQQLNGDFFL